MLLIRITEISRMSSFYEDSKSIVGKCCLIRPDGIGTIDIEVVADTCADRFEEGFSYFKGAPKFLSKKLSYLIALYGFKYEIVETKKKSKKE